MSNLTPAQIEQRREAARARWRNYVKTGLGVAAAGGLAAAAVYAMSRRPKFTGFKARGFKLPPEKVVQPKMVKPDYSGKTLRLRNPSNERLGFRPGKNLQFSSRWANRDASKWNHIPEEKAWFQPKRPDRWGLQADHRKAKIRSKWATQDEQKFYDAHRKRVAESALEGARLRREGSSTYGVVKPRGAKPMSMDTLRLRLSGKITKRQAGTPLSEAERRQRSEAAKARWQEHRQSTAANDIALNSKGMPRQRLPSLTRPREEGTGRIRPLTNEEYQARLREREEKIRAGKAGARWDTRGNLRNRSGQFHSSPLWGSIGEEAASHFFGPWAGVAGRKLGEALAVEAENTEHRGALLGGALGAGTAAALTSKPAKRFVGRRIGSLLGQYKIKGRIAGAIGGKTGRVLARGLAGRRGIKDSGAIIGAARTVLSRRVIGVPLIGAGVYLGARAGGLFRNGDSR